jgi:hypothetical protein
MEIIPIQNSYLILEKENYVFLNFILMQRFSADTKIFFKKNFARQNIKKKNPQKLLIIPLDHQILQF